MAQSDLGPVALEFAWTKTSDHHGWWDSAQLDLAAWCLDTDILNTGSKTARCQFEDRGYSIEVIYCGSDQDYDFKDEKKRQTGIYSLEQRELVLSSAVCSAGIFSHLTLRIRDLLRPNLRRLWNNRPRLWERNLNSEVVRLYFSVWQEKKQLIQFSSYTKSWPCISQLKPRDNRPSPLVGAKPN